MGVYSDIKTEIRESTGVFIPTKVIFGFWGEMVSGELRTSDESLEVGWFECEKVLDMITQPFLKGSKKKLNQAPYIVKGFRLFDKVKFEDKECFVFGRRSSGYFD